MGAVSFRENALWLWYTQTLNFTKIFEEELIGGIILFNFLSDLNLIVSCENLKIQLKNGFRSNFRNLFLLSVGFF